MDDGVYWRRCSAVEKRNPPWSNGYSIFEW
jgi:hypothetical protein